jgi:hypothetical protein
VQKKEKDRVLHENVLDVQDPCFFGQLFAWPPLHALCFYIFYCDFANPAANRLRLVLLSDLWFSDALLRHARRASFASEPPGLREKL